MNTIRPATDRISTTGYPQQRVFDILYEELDAIGGTILLVLVEENTRRSGVSGGLNSQMEVRRITENIRRGGVFGVVRYALAVPTGLG